MLNPMGDKNGATHRRQEGTRHLPVTTARGKLENGKYLEKYTPYYHAFRTYLLYFGVCYALVRCNQPHDDGGNSKRFLREGWLGPTLDGADDQWRELRESLPLICAAIAGHGLLSLLVRETNPSAIGTAVQVNKKYREVRSLIRVLAKQQ